MMEQELNKQQLVAEIERSRAAIARDFRATAECLNFKARAAESFQARPGLWLSGAAVVGWMISGFGKRKKVPSRGERVVASRREAEPKAWKKSQILSGALGFVFTVIKPAASAFLSKRLMKLVEKWAD